jgi:uncharacterized repeat protein (TIGR03806 family)
MQKIRFVSIAILLAGILTLAATSRTSSPGPMGPYLNGIFPPTAPQADGGWELIDPLPGMTFTFPVDIIPFPETEDLLVLGKNGFLHRVSIQDQSRQLLLDLRDSTMNGGESGTVGMVLHPAFGDSNQPDKQQLFLFYRWTPKPSGYETLGYNRLSSFKWDPVSETFDRNSEEVLIQQYDRSTWHNGGAMFFGPDSMLYLGVGDEGPEEYRSVSNQRLDGGLFGGILRIDVDNDPRRSHPIRRQIQNNGDLPRGWPQSFNRGYSIPNDNPWLNENGDWLEEFFALGIRNPYGMHFDPPSASIWVGDVGSSKREEISFARKGDNLQWPYKEGFFDIEDMSKPAGTDFLGQEVEPYIDFKRDESSCLIGGGLYRSTSLAQLQDHYIFGDYNLGFLKAVSVEDASGSKPRVKHLLDLQSQTLDLPEEGKLTDVTIGPDGRVFVSVSASQHESDGKVFQLNPVQSVAEPPSRLSELGAFTDLENLTPAPGLIPYRVNAPLWSDRAIKKRWMALPNDGSFDDAAEQIRFDDLRDWQFPEGTVFIKHFELPLSEEKNSETARLETRFFVVGENGIGYGLTYKWNEEGTEAFLLKYEESRGLAVKQNGLNVATQIWDFPSRSQCMTCHNRSANYVLGVKTSQLNGKLYYPFLEEEMNQLSYLNQLGVFRSPIKSPDNYLQTYHLEDTTASLDLRIRSYLDANCASCHRPNGVPGLSMNLTYPTALKFQNIIEHQAQSMASDQGRKLVVPGDPQASELWHRDATMAANRMPPIGRDLVDSVYIKALTTWIEQLPQDAGILPDFTLYPNPNQGWVSIHIGENWEPPYEVFIRSASGQSLYQGRMEQSAFILDFAPYAAGIYLLEVANDQHREIRKLVRR